MLFNQCFYSDSRPPEGLLMRARTQNWTTKYKEKKHQRQAGGRQRMAVPRARCPDPAAARALPKAGLGRQLRHQWRSRCGSELCSRDGWVASHHPHLPSRSRADMAWLRRCYLMLAICSSPHQPVGVPWAMPALPGLCPSLNRHWFQSLPGTDTRNPGQSNILGRGQRRG